MELKDNIIILDRIPSEIDKFAIDFLKILEKHVEYVLISGYISILLGRVRSTDDIDVFIKRISKEKFSKLYEELEKSDFWCLNAESLDEVFSYIQDGLSIRFARVNTSTPNFEIRFPRDELEEGTFQETINVKLKIGNIIISSLERHIAFKRVYLSSDKDKEDALHIEQAFAKNIDINKVNKYEMLINERKKKQGHGK